MIFMEFIIYIICINRMIDMSGMMITWRISGYDSFLVL